MGISKTKNTEQNEEKKKTAKKHQATPHKKKELEKAPEKRLRPTTG